MLPIIMAATSPSLAFPDPGTQQSDARHHCGAPLPQLPIRGMLTGRWREGRCGDGDLCTDDKSRVDT